MIFISIVQYVSTSDFRLERKIRWNSAAQCTVGNEGRSSEVTIHPVIIKTARPIRSAGENVTTVAAGGGLQQ